MKTPLRLATALAAVFLLTSCSAPAVDTTGDSTSAPTEHVEEVEEAPEPVDLTGEWKQTNSGAEDSFQSATRSRAFAKSVLDECMTHFGLPVVPDVKAR